MLDFITKRSITLYQVKQLLYKLQRGAASFVVLQIGTTFILKWGRYCMQGHSLQSRAVYHSPTKL